MQNTVGQPKKSDACILEYEVDEQNANVRNGAKPTFEFSFNLTNFVGKMKSNSGDAFHDLFYALKSRTFS